MNKEPIKITGNRLILPTFATAMSKVESWFKAFRLRTLPLSFSSVILGSLLALWRNSFDIWILVGALCTTLFLQVLFLDTNHERVHLDQLKQRCRYVQNHRLLRCHFFERQRERSHVLTQKSLLHRRWKKTNLKFVILFLECTCEKRMVYLDLDQSKNLGIEFTNEWV